MSGLLIIALAPVAIIAFYIYFRDKYEKEPWKLLTMAMTAGALITVPVIFVEHLLSIPGQGLPPMSKAAWDAFMVAALCEEAFKYAALFLLIWKNRAFNEKFDGIVYATFISLGFAAIENILYVNKLGLSTGLARALTAVPAHALFGITMGYYFGRAKFYPHLLKKYLLAAFVIPFALHGIYDFMLMSGNSILLLLFIPFILYLWVNGFQRLKTLNRQSVYNTDIDMGIDFSKIKQEDGFNNEDASKF